MSRTNDIIVKTKTVAQEKHPVDEPNSDSLNSNRTGKPQVNLPKSQRFRLERLPSFVGSQTSKCKPPFLELPHLQLVLGAESQSDASKVECLLFGRFSRFGFYLQLKTSLRFYSRVTGQFLFQLRLKFVRIPRHGRLGAEVNHCLDNRRMVQVRKSFREVNFHG